MFLDRLKPIDIIRIWKPLTFNKASTEFGERSTKRSLDNQMKHSGTTFGENIIERKRELISGGF